ncbi:MAG: hypothetical protein RL538_356 [Candidatus Parcubacteria bacterium]
MQEDVSHAGLAGHFEEAVTLVGVEELQHTDRNGTDLELRLIRPGLRAQTFVTTLMTGLVRPGL